MRYKDEQDVETVKLFPQGLARCKNCNQYELLSK